MLNEYDVVRLKRAIPGVPVPLPTLGAVHRVHPTTPPTYEVEFIDAEGESLGMYTLKESNLKKVKPSEFA